MTWKRRAGPWVRLRERKAVLMKDKKLTWPQRGRLWLRLGLRLVLVLLALWLLRAVGRPLLSPVSYTHLRAHET